MNLLPEYESEPKPEMVDTFLGKMPSDPSKSFNEDEQKRFLDAALQWGIPTSGLNVLGKEAAELGGKIAKSFMPGKKSKEFVKSLGEGTAEENVGEFGKRLEFAKKSAKGEALEPKEELMSTESQNKILSSLKNPDPVINKSVSIFAEHPEDITTSRMNSLKTALKNYYKNGDFEKLIEKGEDIFEHPGLEEDEIKKLEESLKLPKIDRGKYLSLGDHNEVLRGERGLKKLHKNFEENPTLFNADKLKSGLGKEKRVLEGKGKSIDTAGSQKLKDLIEYEKAINDDIENYTSKLSPEKQYLYNKFRTKYATNVAPYESSGKMIELLSEGKAHEVKPGQIASKFESPNKNLQKILQDIGPSGNKNILFDLLKDIDSSDSEKIVSKLKSAKQSKGFQRYITPEVEDIISQLEKSIRNKKMGELFGGTLLGGLGGAMFGHPAIGAGFGAASGAGKAFGKDFLKALTKVLLKK